MRSYSCLLVSSAIRNEEQPKETRIVAETAAEIVAEIVAETAAQKEETV